MRLASVPLLLVLGVATSACEPATPEAQPFPNAEQDILAQERTILGDEMGLGKTMQTLAAMNHRSSEEGAARFFVVAPAGLLINWSREIEKFTPLVPHVLHGDDFEENLARWIREGGVAITSYATLRNTDVGAALEDKSARTFADDETIASCREGP